MSNVAPSILTMRDAILGQLSSQLQASADPDVQPFGWLVDKYPGDPKIYKPQNPLGAILVFYRGSKSNDSMASAPRVTQLRQVDFDITILSLDLLSQDKATKLVDAIYLAITGFLPSWADRPMWISKDGFVGNKGGLWQYGILAHARFLSLQQGNLS